MGYYNDKLHAELKIRQAQMEAIYNKARSYEHLTFDERNGDDKLTGLYKIACFVKSKLNIFNTWIDYFCTSSDGQQYYNTKEDYERTSLLARLTIVNLELLFEFYYSFQKVSYIHCKEYISNLYYDYLNNEIAFNKIRLEVNKNPLYIDNLIKEKREVYKQLLVKHPYARKLYADLPYAL